MEPLICLGAALAVGNKIRIALEDWKDSITAMWFETFRFESAAFKLRFEEEDV